MKKIYLSFLSLFMAVFVMGQADSVNITFQVNMANETVDGAGVFIAGGGNFGNPGDNQLTNSSGTLYEWTTKRPKGFASFYTLTNGACPDYSCKENLAGKPCGDPGNFNDRYLTAVLTDTTLMHCFSECTEDLSCPTPATPVNVIFKVDMSETAPVGPLYVTGGGLDNWCGTCLEMTDLDGDNIFSDTLSLVPGTYEYKFNNGGWGGTEGLDPTDDAACTLTTGGYTNRLVTVGMADTTLTAVCFNACDPCSSVGIKDIVAPSELFTLSPIPATDHIMIEFKTNEITEKRIQLFDISGRIIMEENAIYSASNHRLSVSNIPTGVYLLSVVDKDSVSTQKVVIR